MPDKIYERFLLTNDGYYLYHIKINPFKLKVSIAWKYAWKRSSYISKMITIKHTSQFLWVGNKRFWFLISFVSIRTFKSNFEIRGRHERYPSNFGYHWASNDKILEPGYRSENSIDILSTLLKFQPWYILYFFRRQNLLWPAWVNQSKMFAPRRPVISRKNSTMLNFSLPDHPGEKLFWKKNLVSCKKIVKRAFLLEKFLTFWIWNIFKCYYFNPQWPICPLMGSL